MPAIFWTGKLSPLMFFVVNANNVMAWLTGNARDTAAMKNRVKQGYDGAFSEHVTRYDKLGAEFQKKTRHFKKSGKKTESPEQSRSAKLAFDIFTYQVKKYIGAYYAILGGCDLLVFTGSVGAGISKTRNAICKDLNILKNTRVLAIKTDEELEIARKVKIL